MPVDIWQVSGVEEASPHGPNLEPQSTFRVLAFTTYSPGSIKPIHRLSHSHRWDRWYRYTCTGITRLDSCGIQVWWWWVRRGEPQPSFVVGTLWLACSRLWLAHTGMVAKKRKPIPIDMWIPMPSHHPNQSIINNANPNQTIKWTCTRVAAATGRMQYFATSECIQPIYLSIFDLTVMMTAGQFAQPKLSKSQKQQILIKILKFLFFLLLY